MFNESHYKTFFCWKAKENEKKTSRVLFQGNFKIELIYNLIGAPCAKAHNFPSYEIRYSTKKWNLDPFILKFSFWY